MSCGRNGLKIFVLCSFFKRKCSFLTNSCQGQFLSFCHEIVRKKAATAVAAAATTTKHEQQLPKYVRRRWPKRENVLSSAPKEEGLGVLCKEENGANFDFFGLPSARILLGANECLVLFLWKYPFFLCPKFASPPLPTLPRDGDTKVCFVGFGE